MADAERDICPLVEGEVRECGPALWHPDIGRSEAACIVLQAIGGDGDDGIGGME